MPTTSLFECVWRSFSACGKWKQQTFGNRCNIQPSRTSSCTRISFSNPSGLRLSASVPSRFCFDARATTAGSRDRSINSTFDVATFGELQFDLIIPRGNVQTYGRNSYVCVCRWKRTSRLKDNSR